MKNCSHCGKELEPDMTVCPFCGTEIKDVITDITINPEGKEGMEQKKVSEIPCPHCGRLIPQVAIACPYCGKRVSGFKNRKKLTLFVIVLIIIVGAIVGVLVSQKMERDKKEAIYSQAQVAMNSFDYEQAQQLLNTIPEYKDAQDLLQQAQDGEFMASCAQYIYNFIQDGNFYNPSAVRLLEAAYVSSANDELSEVLEADGMLYITVQGTNRIGGTLSKDYVIVIGGAFDGLFYENEDENAGGKNNYDVSDKPVDVALLNKMLQKYWADMGIS